MPLRVHGAGQLAYVEGSPETRDVELRTCDDFELASMLMGGLPHCVGGWQKVDCPNLNEVPEPERS
jgi:hypothetical protein